MQFALSLISKVVYKKSVSFLTICFVCLLENHQDQALIHNKQSCVPLVREKHGVMGEICTEYLDRNKNDANSESNNFRLRAGSDF